MTHRLFIQVGVKKDFDFGNMSDEYSQYEIMVDPEYWYAYIEKRRQFEQVHNELIQKIPLLKRQRMLKKEVKI